MIYNDSESQSDEIPVIYCMQDSIFIKTFSNNIIKNIIIPIVNYLQIHKNLKIDYETIIIRLCNGTEHIRTPKISSQHLNYRKCKRKILRGTRKGLECGKKCQKNSDYCSKNCKILEEKYQKNDEYYESDKFSGLFSNNKQYIFTKNDIGGYLLIGYTLGNNLAEFKKNKIKKLKKKYEFDSSENIHKFLLLYGNKFKFKNKFLSNKYDNLEYNQYNIDCNLSSENSSHNSIDEGIYNGF